MPGAWTDLSVAARLGARLVARRFSGSGDDAPDLRSFRDTLEDAVGRVSSAIAEHTWVELFSDATSDDGRPELHCSVQHDVGILQKEVAFELTPETELSWEWLVDRLPSAFREDSVPSHDYLGIAVGFENSWGLTYYWSRPLAPETGFICPLPNWKDKEFHVVVRSGADGLGSWQRERRDVPRLRGRSAGEGHRPAPSVIGTDVIRRRVDSAAAPVRPGGMNS